MKKLSLRCISVIMALLFAFAPLSSAFAIKIPGLVTYPTEKKIAETLGGYLKARDVDGIVGMFSEKVKSEMPDLRARVQNLLDDIDCDIVSYHHYGRSESDKSNYGYYQKTGYMSNCLILLPNHGRLVTHPISAEIAPNLAPALAHRGMPFAHGRANIIR